MSPWLLLAVAIVAEVGATVALRWSDGSTRPLPTLVVIAGYGVAFWLLSRIVQHLPASVTYAAWTGAGIALVALAGVVLFGEVLTTTKAVSLAVVVLGIVGLQVSGDGHGTGARPSAGALRGAGG